MTFKLLANNSKKVFYHSAICSVIEPGEQNLRVDPLGGEPPSFMKLSHDPVTQMPFDPGGQDLDSTPTKEDETKLSQLPMFHPSDLVGHTFLLDPQEDGQRFCACIIQAIEDHDFHLHGNADWFNFHCSIKYYNMRRFSPTMRSSITLSSRMMIEPNCGSSHASLPLKAPSSHLTQVECHD